MALTGPKTGFKTFPQGKQVIYSNSLWAWGDNTYGQLGNQTRTDSIYPIPVGTLVDWKQVSCSGYYFAAIKADGTLWTSGYNRHGGLGVGDTVYRSSPIQVGSLTDWAQVSNSYSFMGATKTDGTLWTCGYNIYGNLGNGTTINYSSPIQIGALTTWSQITCSNSGGFCFAIQTDETLWTWGDNTYGQLGLNNISVQYSSPVQVGSLTDWAQISCSPVHVAAVKTDGTLWTWGRNTQGCLGNGTTIDYSSPVQVGSLTNWAQVTCGAAGSSNHTIAVKTDGTLWACGYNLYGGLGNGSVDSYSSPIQIGSLTNWKQVTAGYLWSSAVKTDGTLWTWGYNGQGQLGNRTVGVLLSYSSPIQVGSANAWGSVSAGYYSALAIPSLNYFQGQINYYTDSVAACGYNQVGQLGNGNLQSSYFLNNFDSSKKYSQIECGEYVGSIMGIRTDGTLWGCGTNYTGSLGNGTRVYYSSPIQIGSLTNWKQVSTRGVSTIAVKTDGSLWGWGFNGNGTIGNGTTTDYSSPVQVGSLTDWSQVSVAGAAVGSIKTDGTLWTWGFNNYGQLGNGTTIAYSSPIQIGSMTNWKQVTASETYFMAAIKTDGTLWAWGMGDYGQLGNGTTLRTYSSPIQIGSLTDWSQVSSMNYVTAAVKTDGTLWTWGENSEGCLGNGNTINYSSPIQVGSLTNWKQVSCGSSFTVAVKIDGSLWGWGWNRNGQLSTGQSDQYFSSPIQVGSLSIWSSISAGLYTIAAIASSNGVETFTQDIGDRYVSRDYLLDTYPNMASATGARKNPGLWTWGSNANGKIGNGTANVNYSSPIQIGSLTNWKIAAGGANARGAIKTDGTLWMWGNGGNVGSGATVDYSSPVQIGTSTDWQSLTKGGMNGHMAAIKTNGTLWIWGNNGNGQLGNGTTINYSSPIQVGALTNWASIGSGSYHNLAVKKDGTMWAWGWGAVGSLGNGTTISYSSPIQIGALTNWKQTAGGVYYYSAAIKTNGTLWTWGAGSNGALGNGDTVHYSSPIQIGALTNWKQVTIGNANMSAIKTDGTLWTWGANSVGQLGNGTTVDYSSPIQIGGLTNWKYVSMNTAHTAALKTDGTLWAWGTGSAGRLGNGDNANYSSPIQIGTLTTWKQLADGYTTMAAIADGYY